MGDKTAIEWCDATFNPWIGCQAISPGCDHCYAESYAKRVGRDFAKRTRTSAAYWKQPLKWNATAAAAGKPLRVFCASLADVFDNEVPRGWRIDLWSLIEATPHLTWLLLTKRIGNVARMVPPSWMKGHWPAHAWLGISVVNQEEADRDIPKLLQTPARIRFLSCEPLLGAIDLTRIAPNEAPGGWRGTNALDDFQHAKLDWVISGGESGPKARPSHPDWHRSLRDQCAAAGVAFLFKQHGEWVQCDTEVNGDERGREVHPHEESVLERMSPNRGYTVTEAHGAEFVRVGKKAAGRMLDGRSHDEFPS